MKYLPFLLLTIAFFLESAILSWPLVLGILILLAAIYRSQWVLGIAFISGIILDVLTFHLVGSSSLFFVGVLALVFLYQRKFQIESPFFVGISVFVFSLLYGAVFIHKYSFFSAVLTAIVISGVYLGLSLVQEPRKNSLV